LNLAATADFLHRNKFTEVLLVCAGTGENPALEDVLAAGALVELLATGRNDSPARSDSTEIARRTFLQAQPDLPAVFDRSQNARRLLAISELREDVAFCRQRDIFNLIVEMGTDGALRRL
jgi:phosphosulfolactate phosphohydrolase-like enzyme